MVVAKCGTIYVYFRPNRGYFYTRFKASKDPQTWETPEEMKAAWAKYGGSASVLAPACLGTWEE